MRLQPGRLRRCAGALERRDRVEDLHFTAPTMDTAEGVLEGDFAPADADAPATASARVPRPHAAARAGRSKARRRRQAVRARGPARRQGLAVLVAGVPRRPRARVDLAAVRLGERGGVAGVVPDVRAADAYMFPAVSLPLPVCTFMVLCAAIFAFGKVYLYVRRPSGSSP